MAIRVAICRPPHAAARRGLALGAALVTAIALGQPAHAESANGVPDPVAQALFQDGRDLVDKGSWDAGCTKFEASMLLYPAASTLLNIARCHEHARRLASAWSAYKRAQVLNRETLGDERKRAIDEMIVQQIEALTPRLPKFKLRMTRDVLGVTLRKDGEVMPSAVIGTTVPVDVGEHEITAEAPGYRLFRFRFDAKESALTEIAIDLVSDAASDVTDSARVPTWAWLTGGGSLILLGLSAGFRVDQAFTEGRQYGMCNGNVQGGCPPKETYDPASDNARKNLDFALFVGLGAAGAAAFAASVIGIIRGTRPAKAPVAGLVVSHEGAALAATFQF